MESSTKKKDYTGCAVWASKRSNTRIHMQQRTYINYPYKLQKVYYETLSVEGKSIVFFCIDDIEW